MDPEATCTLLFEAVEEFTTALHEGGPDEINRTHDAVRETTGDLWHWLHEGGFTPAGFPSVLAAMEAAGLTPTADSLRNAELTGIGVRLRTGRVLASDDPIGDPGDEYEYHRERTRFLFDPYAD